MTALVTMAPQTLFMACAGLLVFGALTVIYIHCSGLGIGLFGCTAAWGVVAGAPPSVPLGIDAQPADILVLAALTAALFTLVSGPRPPCTPELGALAVLMLLVLGSLAAGAVAHGLQAAGNEARVSFLHVFGVAAYVAVARPGLDLLPAFRRVWIGLALLSALVALIGWSRYGIGSNSSQVLIDGRLANGRPVTAVAALLICQAALIMLVLGRRCARLLAGILLLVMVLLQHRSVWVCALVMVGGWLLLRPQHRLRALAGTAAAVAVATVVVLLGHGLALMETLAQSASDDRTMNWRVAGWASLLEQLRDLPDWLLGRPFGTGFARLGSAHAVIDVSPHNYYLQLLLRIGLVGLAALALLLVCALCRVGRRDSVGLLLWLLVLGELVFWITYAPGLTGGLLIGLLLRYAAETGLRRPGRAAPPPPVRTLPATALVQRPGRQENSHVPV
ncbi:O-antigen ligase family protein [Streptomyces jeddahensis]|uniref:O-antigen ligase n=1 Tax=Streptomyces jeddahensis TaxID=1716141 RepID=A0A177HHF0_9ACTN|nr:O-antigen ligase family protein [Streptomyces jeddahensis]OAH09608.1 O-antigen ligase [Streptomyces jeddahensis]